MNDFRRLGEEGDAFERQLLASARRDRMSPAARGALIASVAAGASVVAGGASAQAAQVANVGKAAKTGISALVKWIALGAAGSAVIAAVAVPIARSHRANNGVGAETTIIPPAPIESAPNAPDENGVAIELPADDDTADKNAAAHHGHAPINSHPRHRPPAVPSSSSDGSSLTAELALIEQARTALGSGRPADAIHALDEYRTRFGRGALSEEASVLRIESLARMGDTATAANLARSFLTTRPRSPYAARVRRVLSTIEGDKAQ